jgi:hypothetical protein
MVFQANRVSFLCSPYDIGSVRPFVRSSPISQPLQHLESWNFKYKSVHLQWSIVRPGIFDPWPGSPEIWPWPGHLPIKIKFTSITRVPTIIIGHMMARLKGLSVRTIFSLRLMVICACGLLSNRPKSQNSNIRHDQEFYADVEKTHGPQFGTYMLHGFNGHDPVKVPKYKYAMMVLFRSENCYWILLFSE